MTTHKTAESLIGALGISRGEFARWCQYKDWPGKVGGVYHERAIRAWARRNDKTFKPSPARAPEPKTKPPSAIHIAGLTDAEDPSPFADDPAEDENAPSVPEPGAVSIPGLTDDAPAMVIPPPREYPTDWKDPDAGNADPLQEGRRIRNERERLKLAADKKLVISRDRAINIASEFGKAHVSMLQELPARLAAHFPELDPKLFRDRCRSTLADLRERNTKSLAKVIADNLGPEPPIEDTLAKIKLTKDDNVRPFQPASDQTDDRAG